MSHPGARKKKPSSHLNHAKTLLVVSSGDFENVPCEFIAEAFALNSLMRASGFWNKESANAVQSQNESAPITYSNAYNEIHAK